MTEQDMNFVEALREIRRLVENGDDWGGGENVYLSRKWIIKLCDDTLAAIDAEMGET